jgi:uncharacterized BrkB/YihY/UPF0761 family membrane protein
MMRVLTIHSFGFIWCKSVVGPKLLRTFLLLFLLLLLLLLFLLLLLLLLLLFFLLLLSLNPRRWLE